MIENNYIGDPPRGDVYIGYERGSWPLRAFQNAEHAATWVNDVKHGVRYIWRYELINPVAMEVVPEVRTPATLTEKASD